MWLDNHFFSCIKPFRSVDGVSGISHHPQAAVLLAGMELKMSTAAPQPTLDIRAANEDSGRFHNHEKAPKIIRNRLVCIDS